MPAKLRVQKRLYYKIGEACKLLDVQPYVLRYWETEFPVLSPAKSRSGQRVYNEKELAIIRRIKELLYDEGYTIAGAKKKLEADLAAGVVARLDLEAEAAAGAAAAGTAEPAARPPAPATAAPGEEIEAGEGTPPVPAAAAAVPARGAAAGATFGVVEDVEDVEEIEGVAATAPEPAEQAPAAGPQPAQLRLRPRPAPEPAARSAAQQRKLRAGLERALGQAREILALLDSRPPIK
jgi:DNA-binding transcriptional MerR regulator